MIQLATICGIQLHARTVLMTFASCQVVELLQLSACNPHTLIVQFYCTATSLVQFYLHCH
jgi:hypothetical protein